MSRVELEVKRQGPMNTSFPEATSATTHPPATNYFSAIDVLLKEATGAKQEPEQNEAKEQTK